MDGLERFRIDMMTIDQANQYLSLQEKEIWVERHNRTANLYYLNKNIIKEVPPVGWWY